MRKFLVLVFKIKVHSFIFHVINYSYLVKSCSIPSVCGDSSLLNSFIINHDNLFCATTRQLYTINTLSNSLITIVNNSSSLNERN